MKKTICLLSAVALLWLVGCSSKDDAIAELNKNAVAISTEGLMYSASQGDKRSLELLLKAGLDPNLKDNAGNTPLHIAAWAGNKEVIELLLNNNANPNVATQVGLTPHIGAASQGHIEVVRLLLGKNADINAKTVEGSTALMEAIWRKTRSWSGFFWMRALI